MSKGTRPIKGGGAGRQRDRNEPEIVEAYRSERCLVYYITGRNLPDLLIYDTLTRRWFPVGVKVPGAALTPAEEKGVMWPLVETKDEALKVLWSTVRSGTRYGDR